MLQTQIYFLSSKSYVSFTQSSIYTQDSPCSGEVDGRQPLLIASESIGLCDLEFQGFYILCVARMRIKYSKIAIVALKANVSERKAKLVVKRESYRFNGQM